MSNQHVTVGDATHSNRTPQAHGAPPHLPGPDAPGGTADDRRWQLLPVVLAAMFMAQFDLFVVNVAAPSLEVDLHAGSSALELIVGGYSFVYATGLITGGRCGDILGFRRMFVGGVLAFTGASLLCGLARTPAQLVGARLVQGLTAAAMVPQVLAIITSVFPVPERPRALSWFGVTMGIGAVAGQVLGGALLSANVLGLGWRIIFLGNVPIGLGTALLALRLLPRREGATRPRLDPVGALGVSASLALALVPLVLGRQQGWPAWTWLSLLASVPLMVVTLVYESSLGSRGGQPLLDVTLFGDRAFSAGLVVNVGAFASFHGFLFTLTLVLQHGLGLSPMQAGLTFAPLGLAFALASIGAKRFVATSGAAVITAGTALAATGLMLVIGVLSTSGNATTANRLVLPMIVVGLGNGLAVPALVGSVLAGVRAKAAGASAGVLTTSQQFASAAGIAGLGSVFFARLGHGLDALAYVHALRWEAGCSLLLALLACAMSATLPRPPALRTRTVAAPPSAARARTDS